MHVQVGMFAMTKGKNKPVLAKKKLTIIPLSEKAWASLPLDLLHYAFTSWKNQEDKEEERKCKVKAGKSVP